jgi:iron(III) transport system substrate-binding protein
MRTPTLLIVLLTAFTPIVAFADESLVVFNGRAEQFVRPLAERFTAETGIPVILHAGSSTELLNKLRLEGARTEGDLYLSNDAGTLQIGEDEDLFHALPDAVLERIPANYRGRDGSWVGLSARSRVMVVHTGADEVHGIRSLRALADQRLRGRIGVTNAANESFVAGLSVYQALWGEQQAEAWLRGLRANVGREVYPRHGAVVADVAAGRRAVGLVNHYYIFRHLAQHPDAPIRMVVPDQHEDGIGVAWNVAGVAISRHTDQRPAAERFVAFLVSEEGQRMFADANMEFPVRADVPPHDALAAFADTRAADFPLHELAERRGAALDLIDKVGMP